MVTSQRPSGRSNAAIAAWPSKKLSFSKSTMRRAVCSLPMAKVARRVLGVRVAVMGSFGRGVDALLSVVHQFEISAFCFL
jgi:hypothetical protein